MSRPAEDLAGRGFGRWRVICRHGRDSSGFITWLCRCSCGVERHVNGNRLRAGKSKSCGCITREVAAKRMSASRVDLTGRRFGRLVVVGPAPDGSDGRTRWFCSCDCGTVRIAKGILMTRSQKPARSCGCLRKEKTRNRSWRGGRQKTGEGYIRIRALDHPDAVKGYVLEHRVVMEDHLGRLLTQDETVHHKNCVRDDNRIENLELWSGNHPSGGRVSDKVAWAEEILQLYAPYRLAHETEEYAA